MLRALDLFSGAGGITKGLQRAGFHVTGVDLAPQPNYCGDVFIQADATTFPLDGFDFIHASPPCQAHTTLKNMPGAKVHQDLIPVTRERLRGAGVPYSIENVPGAPMPLYVLFGGITLCGSMFGLANEEYELRRHRIFETSEAIPQPACAHKGKTVVGFYGAHVRIRRREKGTHRGTSITGQRKFELASELMGIDWMDQAEIDQAIPPAYAYYVATEVMRAAGVPIG